MRKWLATTRDGQVYTVEGGNIMFALFWLTDDEDGAGFKDEDISSVVEVL